MQSALSHMCGDLVELMLRYYKLSVRGNNLLVVMLEKTTEALLLLLKLLIKNIYTSA